MQFFGIKVPCHGGMKECFEMVCSPGRRGLSSLDRSRDGEGVQLSPSCLRGLGPTLPSQVAVRPHQAMDTSSAARLQGVLMCTRFLRSPFRARTPGGTGGGLRLDALFVRFGHLLRAALVCGVTGKCVSAHAGVGWRMLAPRPMLLVQRRRLRVAVSPGALRGGSLGLRHPSLSLEVCVLVATHLIPRCRPLYVSSSVHSRLLLKVRC